jgi:hypothetical protein
MKSKTSLKASCLLAALAIGLAYAPAAEPATTELKVDLPKPDGKPADMSKPVQVFIMMGQSNMFGMGNVSPETTKGTLEYYVRKEGKYPFLLDADGKWSERKDVRYVQVMPGKGGGMQTQFNDWLAIKAGRKIGPEVGFGFVIGQALDAPVLLLKTCIGNRSLGWDLLPPGSERFEFVQKDKQGAEKSLVFAGYKDRPNSWEMDKAKGTATEPPPWVDKNGKPVEWYAGKQYDDDVANAKAVLADLGKYYPEASKYEVAGFVWWQGHKDQGEPYASRYEQNLVRLIPTLRKDFNAPKAPFVLATIGFGGWKLEGPGKIVAEAQLAISDPKKHPEFDGNVKTIEARGFWREESESPTKAGYHYNGNAGTYMDVGLSLGGAMKDLLKK